MGKKVARWQGQRSLRELKRCTRADVKVSALSSRLNKVIKDVSEMVSEFSGAIERGPSIIAAETKPETKAELSYYLREIRKCHSEALKLLRKMTVCATQLAELDPKTKLSCKSSAFVGKLAAALAKHRFLPEEQDSEAQRKAA